MEQGPRRWVPDNEVSRCFLCATGFDLTTRKHHCRLCGRVACAACTPFKMLVPLNEMVYPPSDASISLTDFDPREVQRVCRECELVLAPIQADLQQTMTHAAMPTHHNRASVDRYLNSPVTFDLKGEILKASNTLLNFTGDNAIEGADSIPKDLISEAKGLAFITFVKVGVFVTMRIGTGLVIARRRDGSWSAPSAVASGGLGWGFQIGGELTDMVIVLNTVGAVEAFAGRGQVSLGTELSLSVGPVGRTASTDVRAGDGGVTAAFSYAHSKGVFLGVSVEAGTLVTRKDANRDFYGADVSAQELLLGDYPQPKAAEPLYTAIEEVESQGALIRGGRLRGHPPHPHFMPQPGPGYYEGSQGEGGAATGQEGVHFAPFQPDAEDHLRSFKVLPEERQQMEEDYRMALAMQKGEAAVAAGGGGGGGGADVGGGGAPLPPPSGTPSMLTRIGSMIDGGASSNGGSGTSGMGTKATSGKGSTWIGSGSSGNKTDDEWERERRARIEQAKMVESGGLAGDSLGGAKPGVGVASELGEMGSFIGGGGWGQAGSGDRGNGFGGAAGGNGAVAEDEEDEDDSSDDDEYRRDIAEFASRKKRS